MTSNHCPLKAPSSSSHPIRPPPPPNPPTHTHLFVLPDKLHKQKEWDQSVWNEYIFFLSHGDYKSPQVR